jgi:hypothetical protein
MKRASGNTKRGGKLTLREPGANACTYHIVGPHFVTSAMASGLDVADACNSSLPISRLASRAVNTFSLRGMTRWSAAKQDAKRSGHRTGRTTAHG